MVNTKPQFRPSPTRVQNSIKILAGTKTNATIKDIEENIKDEDGKGELTEQTGTVVSIQRDKINGDGWTVKGSDGQTYKCSCASSMYDIPSSVERGGILYPKTTIQVKFTVSKVLRRNSITEFLSGLDDKEKDSDSEGSNTSKLDISKWRHGEEATTIIAKPKSAISISNNLISFNYENDNGAVVERENININSNGVSVNGKAMDVNTKETNINSSKIVVNGKDATDIINNQIKESNKNDGGVVTSEQPLPNIVVQRTQNVVQLNITYLYLFVTKEERVIANIKDVYAMPLLEQTFNVAQSTFKIANEDGTEELKSVKDIIKIYTNGIVTISTTDEANEGEHTISTSHTWITNIYNPRTLLIIDEPTLCKYCNINGVIVLEKKYAYINYCPSCNKWHVLSVLNGQICCSQCGQVYCGVCGANIDVNEPKLKLYDEHCIKTLVSNCDDCVINAVSNVYRYYIDYCPVCDKWDKLIPMKKDDNNILYCPSCDTDFCSGCGTIQNMKEEDKNKYNDLFGKIINYEDYSSQNKKLFFTYQEEVD